MVNLTLLFDSIVSGRFEPTLEITSQAISEKVSPPYIINNYRIKAMEEIEQCFQDGKAFVLELLMAARAMKRTLDLLKSFLLRDRAVRQGCVMIGTIKGDLHDIGKDLVTSMLEGGRFEVVQIGIDISADRFIATIPEEQADILGMSALLTTTMSYLAQVIVAIKKAGLKDSVKIRIGDAPVTQSFAKQIGADGHSSKANEAVPIGKL